MTTISSAAEQAPASAPLVGRPDVNRKRMARLGWTFTSPALIIIGAVTIFPIVYSVVISFSNATVSGNGVALNGFTTSNYSLVLKNSTWHYALGFTIIYTVDHGPRGAGDRHHDRARAPAPDRGARIHDGAAADPLVDDHRHQRRAVGLHLPGVLRRGRCHPQRRRPRPAGHPRHADPGHHRLDDRRHLEDHPVRGHHRAGQPGDAARGCLRGGRGGRLVGLVHLLADHRPAATTYPRAGPDLPRAAGVRAVRPALRADQRRPGHIDHLAGHPGLRRDLQEPRLTGQARRSPPPPRSWCCSAACFRCGPSGSRSGRRN